MDSFVSLVRFELFRRVKLFGIRVKSQEGLFRIRVYFAAVVCFAGGGNIGAFLFTITQKVIDNSHFLGCPHGYGAHKKGALGFNNGAFGFSVRFQGCNFLRPVATKKVATI